MNYNLNIFSFVSGFLFSDNPLECRIGWVMGDSNIIVGKVNSLDECSALVTRKLNVKFKETVRLVHFGNSLCLPCFHIFKA